MEAAGAWVGAVQCGARGAQPAHHECQGPAGDDEHLHAALRYQKRLYVSSFRSNDVCCIWPGQRNKVTVSTQKTR